MKYVQQQCKHHHWTILIQSFHFSGHRFRCSSGFRSLSVQSNSPWAVQGFRGLQYNLNMLAEQMDLNFTFIIAVGLRISCWCLHKKSTSTSSDFFSNTYYEHNLLFGVYLIDKSSLFADANTNKELSRLFSFDLYKNRLNVLGTFTAEKV